MERLLAVIGALALLVVLTGADTSVPISARPLSTTSTVTQVAPLTVTQTLLAANTLRMGAIVFNDSASLLYLKLGASASSSSFTVKVQSRGYYELPSGYAGIVDAVSSSVSGTDQILVTELKN